ncbi:MAG: hypothetical protein LBF51_06295 [Zoogloeaceae bacterium]|nr:hypothetical protein [Zoogloeaceae bacterium]
MNADIDHGAWDNAPTVKPLSRAAGKGKNEHSCDCLGGRTILSSVF